MTKPLIIVGLQKSGTSLLKKILASSDQLLNLFEAEGNGLWGQVPPFSPEGHPAGRLYQHHQGQCGHVLTAADYQVADGELVRDRLAAQLAKHPSKAFWLHKNPYLTVRLSWLKQVFPDAVVLACVRKPLPNVYSLLKRYCHSLHGHQPEHGWWGVKPQHWQSLVSDDPLTTAAQQWRWVNQQLLQDRAHVDCFIPYHKLCSEPQQVLAQINQVTGTELACSLPEISCMDDQWQTGGSAVSANQADTNQHPELLMPPLSQEQIHTVEKHCQQGWQYMETIISCPV